MAATCSNHLMLTQHLMQRQVVIPSQQCNSCFYQCTTHHPCLFCKGCLNKSNDVIDRSTNGLVRRNLHLTMQHEKKARNNGITPKENTKEELRWKILAKKALEWEKRMTRCGFCLPSSTRTKLVRFCSHCQKHMCSTCDEKHGKHMLCKYHATVDLLADNNSALL